MSEKEPGKSQHASRPTSASASSEDFPVTASSYTSHHPGDLGYVELVADIQNRLGRLTEAVETLKTNTAAHGEKLSDMGKDIHTAKVTVKIIGAILAALFAFACWIGNKAVDAFIHSREAPAIHQSQSKP